MKAGAALDKQPLGHTGAQSGFSLIEMLAVLLITGMLTASMTLLTGQWLRSWGRGAAHLETGEMLALALDRLAADIEAAAPMLTIGPQNVPAFIGSASSILLVRPSAEGAGATALEVVRLSTSPIEGLVRARGAYRRGRSLPSLSTGDPVQLLRPPFGATFSFRDEAGGWAPDWSALRLPTAVRIVVQNGDQQGLGPIAMVAGVRAALPAVCAKAASFSTCQALAVGEPIGLPAIDAPNSRRSRSGPRGEAR